MPELPEVETIKCAFAQNTYGRRIKRLVFNRENLRFPLPKALPDALAHQRIQTIIRRGKYMLCFAENGHGFVLHLGMSGTLRIEDSPNHYRHEKHDHVELYMDGGLRVVLNDPRRFGFLKALEERTWQADPTFATMGPEPLGNDFNGPALMDALTGRKTPIKAALLDQYIVAGIGNIYACEALYSAEINPQRPTNTLDMNECDRLAQSIQDVLRKAIAAGGSSLKDYRQADGKLGYFQHQWAVYNRERQACPACDCDIVKTGGVQKITQGGRSTFYCESKQR